MVDEIVMLVGVRVGEIVIVGEIVMLVGVRVGVIVWVCIIVWVGEIVK
jgi:hypothetical protein